MENPDVGVNKWDTPWANADADSHSEEERKRPRRGDNGDENGGADGEDDPGRLGDHDYTEEQYQELERKAGAVMFYDVCSRLEECRRVNQETKKTKGTLFGILFDPKIRKQIGTNPPQSLFPIIRFLCPELDHRSGKFRLKGTTICDIYIKVFNLPAAERDKLKKYTDPRKNDQSASGQVDLGETLKGVLKDRVQKDPSKYTVKDVNEKILDKLVGDGTKTTRMNFEQQKDFFSEHVMDKMSCLEQIWLVRIIIREMKRCGITADAAVKFLADGAAQSFNQVKYLRKICYRFALEESAHDMGLVLGTPLDPMLANKAHTVQQAERMLKHEPFKLERKLDGHRLHVHKLGQGKYFFSSRSSKKGSGPLHRSDQVKQDKFDTLKPVLEKAISVEKCILDGELMGWDPVRSEYTKFELICGVHLRTGSSDSDQFLYTLFDLVYFEGEGTAEAFVKAGVKPCLPQEVRNLPLEDRLKLLSAITTVQDKHLEFIESKIVRSIDTATRLQEIERFYDRAIENNWEGLIIKNLRTPYVAKSREHWWKLKPDYANDTQTMDVIVLGGYFREGSLWTGHPSRFLVGIARKGNSMDVDDDGIAKQYHVFAKVASGLRTEEREKLEAKLRSHWYEPPESGPMPDFMSRWLPSKEDRPARIIDPRHSVILEVLASELVESKSFPGVGWTMRCPRIRKIRYDKPVKDALDIKGFFEIKENFRKSREDRTRDAKKGLAVARIKRGFRVADGFLMNVENIDQVESETFDKVKLCVLTFTEYTTERKDAAKFLLPEGAKRKMKGKKLVVDHNRICALAVKHGAEVITQLPKDAEVPNDDSNGGRKRKRSEKKRLFIVAPSPTCQVVRNIVENRGKRDGGLPCDIVSLDWLLECVDRGKLIKPCAIHLYAMTEETAERLRRSYDEYKDSYTEPATADGLRKVFDGMERDDEEQEWRDLAAKHLAGDADELACLDGQANLFWMRGYVFYVDCFETLGHPCPTRKPLLTSSLTPLRARLRLRGAFVVDELDETVTVVVVDKRDPARFLEIHEMARDLRWATWRTTKQWMVVDKDWIDRCLEEGEMAMPSDELMLHLPTLLKQRGEEAAEEEEVEEEI